MFLLEVHQSFVLLTLKAIFLSHLSGLPWHNMANTTYFLYFLYVNETSATFFIFLIWNSKYLISFY